MFAVGKVTFAEHRRAVVVRNRVDVLDPFEPTSLATLGLSIRGFRDHHGDGTTENSDRLDAMDCDQHLRLFRNQQAGLSVCSFRRESIAFVLVRKNRARDYDLVRTDSDLDIVHDSSNGAVDWNRSVDSSCSPIRIYWSSHHAPGNPDRFDWQCRWTGCIDLECFFCSPGSFSVRLVDQQKTDVRSRSY